MYLIVGLGNPGQEYALSRHNAGWIVADSIASRLGAGKPKTKFNSLFWEGLRIEGVRLFIQKPMTYMNRSGIAVREAVSYFDLPLSCVLIIYDDVALPFGSLRLREHGSAGGQKGMVSVLGALGTMEVPRLRIGVGCDDTRDLSDWVLGHFNKDEKSELDKLTDKCFEGIKLFVKGQTANAMNYLNAPIIKENKEIKEKI